MTVISLSHRLCLQVSFHAAKNTCSLGSLVQVLLGCHLRLSALEKGYVLSAQGWLYTMSQPSPSRLPGFLGWNKRKHCNAASIHNPIENNFIGTFSMSFNYKKIPSAHLCKTIELIWWNPLAFLCEMCYYRFKLMEVWVKGPGTATETSRGSCNSSGWERF